MKRSVLLLAVLALVGASLAVSAATSVGLVLGLDPTGLFVFSALAETSITPDLDLRTEAGIATADDIAGLMLATATILYHYPLEPFDPYIGLGGGFALTPPPFSTGVVAEAVGGVRIIPSEPFVLFGQVRFLVRWSGGSVTTGPVYEAGVQIRF